MKNKKIVFGLLCVSFVTSQVFAAENSPEFLLLSLKRGPGKELDGQKAPKKAKISSIDPIEVGHVNSTLDKLSTFEGEDYENTNQRLLNSTSAEDPEILFLDACHYGETEKVKLLVENKDAQVENKDAQFDALYSSSTITQGGSKTLLYLACEQGKKDVVEILFNLFPRLYIKADIGKQIQNDKGKFTYETAFHVACILGFDEIVSLFLEKDMIKDFQEGYEEEEGAILSPLYSACSYRKNKIVQILLDYLVKHKKVSEVNKEVLIRGQLITPFYIACQERNRALVESFLQYPEIVEQLKKNFNTKGLVQEDKKSNYLSPFYTACEMKQHKLVDLLVKYIGKDIDVRKKYSKYENSSDTFSDEKVSCYEITNGKIRSSLRDKYFSQPDTKKCVVCDQYIVHSAIKEIKKMCMTKCCLNVVHKDECIVSLKSKEDGNCLQCGGSFKIINEWDPKN